MLAHERSSEKKWLMKYEITLFAAQGREVDESEGSLRKAAQPVYFACNSEPRGKRSIQKSSLDPLRKTKR